MGGWPLLRRAPGRILTDGALALMVVVSVALLAGLVAAGPLFGAATHAGGLERRLAAIPATAPPSQRAVLRVVAYDGPRAGTGPRITALVQAVPYLQRPVISVAADAWQLDQAHPVPYVRLGATRLVAVLYARTAAVAGLQVVSGTPGASGIWLPAGVAQDLGARPGSRIEIGKTYRQVVPSCGAQLSRVSGETRPDRRTTVLVAGTYRTAPDGRLPLGPYFAHLGVELPSDPGHCPTSALLLISDQRTVDTALAALAEKPVWTLTSALAPAGHQPAHLARAAAGADALRLGAVSPGSPVATLMAKAADQVRVDSGLPAIDAQARADAVTARQQGRGIGYAGGALGLAAVVVALRALAQRRRRETELLLGLGTPTRVLLAAGALELLLPTVLGAAAGWGLAWLAFARYGPQPALYPAAVVAAGVAAGLVAVVALVANALVTIGQIWQVGRAMAGRPGSRLAGQWLPLLTGATVIAVGATLARGAARQSYQDPLSALLPILVLACGCALVTRAVTGTAGLVRAFVGRRLSPRPPARPGRLVLRGLRQTGVAVADLVLVLGIGVGVLAYGLLCSAQVRQSAGDKAAVLAGAHSTVHIPHSWLLGAGEGPAPRLAAGDAVVWRAGGVISPDNAFYDVLAVDPTALPAAAGWGSGRRLAGARAALAALGPPVRGTAALPALVVGSSELGAGGTGALQAGGRSALRTGGTAELRVGFVTAPIRIQRRLAAFPGVLKPTVVLDARSLFPRLPESDNPSLPTASGIDVQGSFATWLWSQRALAPVLDGLAARGVPAWESSTLEQARATPALTSSRWAAGYQVVLGLAAAALAGLAVIVAVDRRVARAAPVDLVLRRFGLRPGRLVALRTIELAGTGLAALAVLAVPLAVLVLLLPRLIEPAPDVPPAMPVAVTGAPLLLAVAAAAIVTVLAALVAARRSATLDPGEVLRDDQ